MFSLFDFKKLVTSYINANEPAARIEENGFIQFSQNIILGEVTSGKLHKVKIKYNGLCEIICNYILLEDLLGKENLLPLHEDVQANWLNTQSGFEQLGMKFKENSNFVTNNRSKYGDKITLENLRKVEDTHILDVTNFFTRLIAVLFSIYPCNLFSNSPFAKSPYSCTKLPNGKTQICVDKSMLSERLNQLEVGFYIKFFAFKKNKLSMEGHSMLIKKMSDNKYSFFDPNHGEYLNLNIDELAEKINKATEEQSANQMVFLDAKDFVNSYQINKKEVDDERLNSMVLPKIL
ncbi:hypothetical protein [Legionella waltersii]|uniref:Peptidase C58 YopT-type domain-containing protein n=1 Tax=Legionella waltersii TaxID=66969 RepID=A0A0W1AP62_9GAMM|nr:hypothetical protein [Legionella waltersii]KTD83129.1 hypothetical protein Lwal_0037 [Legionella waltersii]SNU96821.1 Uncharacterised protein [Legionella waltersii]